MSTEAKSHVEGRGLLVAEELCNTLPAEEQDPAMERMKRNPFYGSRFNMINDLPNLSSDWGYATKGKQKGELIQKLNPWYSAWHAIIRRSEQAQTPMFSGWRTASVFKAWYDDVYFEGSCIHNGLLDQHNRTWCPAYTTLIPRGLFDLLNGHNRARPTKHGLPKGVRYDKVKGKYRVVFKVDGKWKSFGYHSTVVEAEAVYKQKRLDVVLDYLDELKGHQHYDKFGYAVEAYRERLVTGVQTL